MKMMDKKFPKYIDFDPKVPVWCVTPDRPRCMHRFFDTSTGKATLLISITDLLKQADFVQVNAAGSGLAKMLEGNIGSGHPTVAANGNHLLTDTYTE